MNITHNQINNAILTMEAIVSKGQPFAKHNKDRRIRAVLRDMRKSQGTPPMLRDVWFYVKMWVVSKIKELNRKL